MAQIRYKTRGNSAPNGKPSLYLSGHPEEFHLWTSALVEDLLACCDCAVYYYDDPAVQVDELYLNNLEQFQLLIIPVTKKLLTEGGRALETDLPFALEHRISVLPIIMEKDLLEPYTDIFGALQFLDKNQQDETAIAYTDKLSAFLRAVTTTDDQLEQIRKAFDSYIFLSYRKKDRKHAQDLMRLIHNTEGFSDVAIWYDEFLTPGEDFSRIIDEALQHAPVFALAVTPNLLSPGNYVMDHEYPAAIKHEKNILAAQMVETDRQQMESCYQQVPDFTDPHNPEHLAHQLRNSFRDIPLGANKDDPQHQFLMGLAYLNGIDVEVDRQRAFAYIEKAAYADLWQAAEKLADMYTYGQGVAQDPVNALAWRFRLHQLLLREMAQNSKDPTLLTHYLENLQAARGDDYAPPRWVRNALKDLLSSHRHLIPEDRLAECLLLDATFNAWNPKEGLPPLLRLCKQSPTYENQRVLLQMYLLRDYNCKKYYKKALRLSQRLLKIRRDPLVLLCYVKAAFGLLEGKERTEKTVTQGSELLEICKQLAENTINPQAVQLMTRIFQWRYSSYWCTETTMQTLLWIKDKAQQAYIQTGAEAEKDNLLSVYETLRDYSKEPQAKEAYRQQADDLKKSAKNLSASSLEFSMNTQYVEMAETAARLAPNGNHLSWDNGIRQLDVPILGNLEALLLDRQARYAVANESDLCRLQNEAIRHWKRHANPEAAVLASKLFLRRLKEYFCDVNSCIDALYTALECISFEWHFETWKAGAAVMPPRTEFWTDFFAQIWDYLTIKDHWFVAAKEHYIHITGYFHTLLELARGNIDAALELCRTPASSRDARIYAALTEALPWLYPDHPSAAQIIYLEGANDAQSKLEEYGSLPFHHTLAMAMNYSDLTALAPQEEVASLAHKAISLASEEFSYAPQSLELLLQLCSKAESLLWNTANEVWETKFAIRKLQEQIRTFYFDPQLLHLYDAYCQRMTEISEDEFISIFRFVYGGSLTSYFPLLSRVTYLYLSAHPSVVLRNSRELLSIQEQLLAQEDSLQNRRYLAKTLLHSSAILGKYSQAFDAINNHSQYEQRLHRASALLAEVKPRWTEEDRLLANDIAYRLQEENLIQVDPAVKEQVEKDYQKDHDVLYMECHSAAEILQCHSSRFLRKDRWYIEKQLSTLQKAAEQALACDFSISKVAAFCTLLLDTHACSKNPKIRKALQVTLDKYAKHFLTWLDSVTPEEFRAVDSYRTLKRCLRFAKADDRVLALFADYPKNTAAENGEPAPDPLTGIYYYFGDHRKAVEQWRAETQAWDLADKQESFILVCKGYSQMLLNDGFPEEAAWFCQQVFTRLQPQGEDPTNMEHWYACHHYLEEITEYLSDISCTDKELLIALGPGLEQFEAFLAANTHVDSVRSFVDYCEYHKHICIIQLCLRVYKRYDSYDYNYYAKKCRKKIRQIKKNQKRLIKQRKLKQ